ncbi:MAG: hypothetical protein ACR2JF_16925 [Iamia sp.]
MTHAGNRPTRASVEHREAIVDYLAEQDKEKRFDLIDRSVTRNGVTSSAYGSWPSSFSVAAAA